MAAATQGHAYLFRQLLALPDCNPLDHKEGCLALHMLLAQTPSPGKPHLQLKPGNPKAALKASHRCWLHQQSACGSAMAGALYNEPHHIMALAVSGGTGSGSASARSKLAC